MRKVAIVTDSTATVPKDLVQALDIHVVPVPLLYGSKTFRDGIDITADEVYRKLRAGQQPPTTTTPSVGDFVRVYAAAAQGASGVLSVHMSPDLSTTHGVAVMASQLVDGVPIRVFNCDTAAMGQGFVVLEAARAAARGASLDEVLKRAKEVAAKTHLLFTLDTFEYLHRGGRIGGAASLLGTALQIKPVLYLDGGRIEVMAKPRTKPKAIRLILQRIAEQAEGRRLHAAIIHADVPQEAEELRKTVAERFNCAELYVTEFTPVMGAHTGPGILGVAFYAE
jgi:DegV family protein with EDD domain